MDDPLSAVDPHVGRALFMNCISTYLANKPRILVTHQLQYVKHCERVLIIEHGEITAQGPVESVMQADLLESDKDNSVSHDSNFIKVLNEFAGANDNNELDNDSDHKNGAITEKQRTGLLAPDLVILGAPEDPSVRGRTMVAEERAEGM